MKCASGLEKPSVPEHDKSMCRRCNVNDPVDGEWVCKSCYDKTAASCVQDFRLAPEQQRLFERVAKRENVFYTGPAGTGKSTVLKAIVIFFRRNNIRVSVVTPTGISAQGLRVNATTIYMFAGQNAATMKYSQCRLRQLAQAKHSWQRFTETEVLIIDEISMVENDMLTRLSAMVADVKQGGLREDQAPFGGCQIIITRRFLPAGSSTTFQDLLGLW